MRRHKQRKVPHVSYNDVETLLQRRQEEAPKSGEYLFDYKLEVLKKEIETMSEEEIRKKVKVKFSDLPISKLSVIGLAKRNFRIMTEIQRCVLPHALADRDILGASKTGSGKTLAYLIPVVEKLYLEKFNPLDGLGALIILPTRELALQVFEVLASITSSHPHLSMGLIIGGKNVKYEKEKINRMNILIATPGRLLQHMDESPGFDATNLKILVLDEVDMLLELGFANTLEAIISNIPQERQTLLFSATLSKEIHALAKLSLKKPEYISLHEAKTKGPEENQDKPETAVRPMQFEVPKGLTQYYMLIKAHEKLDTLFSFLRTHTKTKSLVFFSSIKQVRFAYESFKKLNMSRNLPLFELHGKQKQPQRMAIFFGFKEKKHASMFTTNIAARGLDFPSVDWVIQVDCPEDVATYVHRVGRTARYKSGGKSLLMLDPSEEKFAAKLKAKGLTLNRIYPNPNKSLTIKGSLQSFLTEDMNLKHLAQKAFMSYIRGIYLMPDKEVFDLKKIDTDSFAESLGLIQTPVIKFLSKEELEAEEPEEPKEEEQTGPKEKKKKQSKLSKLREKIKQKKFEKLQKAGLANREEELEGNKDGNMEEDKDDDEEEEEEDNEDNEGGEEAEGNEDESDEEEESEEMKKAKKQAKEQSASLKRILQFGNDEEDEFLKVKRRNHEIDLDNIKTELKVSKRQLKKVKLEGHFEGRNKVYFDDEGNKYTVKDVKNRQIAENRMESENRKDEPLFDLIKRKFMNEESDKLREKERVREKRLKKKLKIKALNEQKAGRPVVATLGTPDDEDDEGFGGNQDEEDDEDQEDNEEYGEEGDYDDEDDEDDN